MWYWILRDRRRRIRNKARKGTIPSLLYFGEKGLRIDCKQRYSKRHTIRQGNKKDWFKAYYKAKSKARNKGTKGRIEGRREQKTKGKARKKKNIYINITYNKLTKNWQKETLPLKAIPSLKWGVYLVVSYLSENNSVKNSSDI